MWTLFCGKVYNYGTTVRSNVIEEATAFSLHYLYSILRQIYMYIMAMTRARFPSGAWDKICCSSSETLSLNHWHVWAWAANLVSSSTWKPGPGIYDQPVPSTFLSLFRLLDITFSKRLLQHTTKYAVSQVCSWMEHTWKAGEGYWLGLVTRTEGKRGQNYWEIWESGLKLRDKEGWGKPMSIWPATNQQDQSVRMGEDRQG